MSKRIAILATVPDDLDPSRVLEEMTSTFSKRYDLDEEDSDVVVVDPYFEPVDPQFKPEGEPDEYRDAAEWVTANSRLSASCGMRVSIAATVTLTNGVGFDSRTFDLSADQVRHILAYLSETSES